MTTVVPFISSYGPGIRPGWVMTQSQNTVPPITSRGARRTSTGSRTSLWTPPTSACRPGVRSTESHTLGSGLQVGDGERVTNEPERVRELDEVVCRRRVAHARHPAQALVSEQRHAVLVGDDELAPPVLVRLLHVPHEAREQRRIVQEQATAGDGRADARDLRGR